MRHLVSKYEGFTWRVNRPMAGIMPDEMDAILADRPLDPERVKKGQELSRKSKRIKGLKQRKMRISFSETCRKYGSKKAFKCIMDLMADPVTNDRTRLEASKYILDRAYGKALSTSQMVHTVEAGQTFLDALKSINEKPDVTVSQADDGKMKVIEHDPRPEQ